MIRLAHKFVICRQTALGCIVSTDAPQNDIPTILICDDDVVVRLLARECLEEAGMRVVEAEDGNQALDIFALQQPDLVFLDVDMPGKMAFRSARRYAPTP